MKQLKIGVMLSVFVMLLVRLNVVYAKEVSTGLKKAPMDMTPFYWTIGIVGGLIAVTLVYVSYRKYKGEEKKNPKNGPNS